MTASRATLEHFLTDTAFERMKALAVWSAERVGSVIAQRELPWHVTRLGCRAEYLFNVEAPGTAARRPVRAMLVSTTCCTRRC